MSPSEFADKLGLSENDKSLFLEFIYDYGRARYNDGKVEGKLEPNKNL